MDNRKKHSVRIFSRVFIQNPVDIYESVPVKISGKKNKMKFHKKIPDEIYDFEIWIY